MACRIAALQRPRSGHSSMSASFAYDYSELFRLDQTAPQPPAINRLQYQRHQPEYHQRVNFLSDLQRTHSPFWVLAVVPEGRHDAHEHKQNEVVQDSASNAQHLHARISTPALLFRDVLVHGPRWTVMRAEYTDPVSVDAFEHEMDVIAPIQVGCADSPSDRTPPSS